MRYLIVLFFTIYLHADIYEVKLYEMVFAKLFQKHIIHLCADKNKKMFKNSKILKLTNCKNADIILLYRLDDLKTKNKPYFATSYVDYIHSTAIGAFYWRKGRPQLILNQKMINHYHLHLDESLKKYVK